MRILKSVLLVLSAGPATALIAIAARAGLEATGVKITGNAEVLVLVSSMAVIIASCTRKPSVHSAVRWYEIVFLVLLILGGFSAVFAFFGPEPGWWGKVSLAGFIAAAAVAENRWHVMRAANSHTN